MHERDRGRRICYAANTGICQKSYVTDRSRFSELLEQVSSEHSQYRISHQDTPVARLVSEDLMQKIDQVIDYVVAYDPALADTLALLTNDDARQVIADGTRELSEGKQLPIESLLDEDVIPA